MFRIAIVCLGNICRSPIAHVVLEQRLAAAGLDDRVAVTSAGTGGWHTGEPMDERAAAVLSQGHYDATKHRAYEFTADWYADNDLVLAMDHSNHADMSELAGSGDERAKLRMFREFDSEATTEDREVPDPWFGGAEGFTDVLATIERTADGLVAHLRGRLAP